VESSESLLTQSLAEVSEADGCSGVQKFLRLLDARRWGRLEALVADVSISNIGSNSCSGVTASS